MAHFAHTPATLEAINRARELAPLIGADDWLKDQARQVSLELLARPKLPNAITRREGSKWQRHELRRVTVKPSIMRTLPAKQREVMRKAHPAAFAAAVTVSPPEHPFHVRLDAVKGVRRSTEWNALKQQGVDEWKARLAELFGDRDWSQPEVQAQTLFELRNFRRGVEDKAKKAKIALSEFVIAEDLPLIIPSFGGDGTLVTRRTENSYTVDYDLLEERFPQAATLVNRSEVRGSERVDFRLWVPTAEDPDDSDDSAWGIWKG